MTDFFLVADFGEVERTEHVVAVVLAGKLGALLDDQVRGKVDDRLHAVLADDPGRELLIGHITLDKGGLGGNRPAVTAVEVVQHDDFLAAIDELPCRMGADVACATCDQNRRFWGRHALRFRPGREGPSTAVCGVEVHGDSTNRVGTQSSIESTTPQLSVALIGSKVGSVDACLVRLTKPILVTIRHRG